MYRYLYIYIHIYIYLNLYIHIKMCMMNIMCKMMRRLNRVRQVFEPIFGPCFCLTRPASLLHQRYESQCETFIWPCEIWRKIKGASTGHGSSPRDQWCLGRKGRCHSGRDSCWKSHQNKWSPWLKLQVPVVPWVCLSLHEWPKSPGCWWLEHEF